MSGSVSAAVFGGVGLGAGSDYRFTSEPTGFDVLPTSTSIKQPNTDGSQHVGPSTLESLELVFEVLVQGTQQEVFAKIKALKTVWGARVISGAVPLTVTTADGTSVVLGRPAPAITNMSDARYGVGRARLVFEATDPRMFSADVSSVAMVLGADVGGVTAPVVAPVVAGAGGSGSDATAVNAGGTGTVWSATITGPVVSPRIILGETGQMVELNGTVPLGSTAVVTSADGLVLLDGSPRPTWPTLRSRFFALPPGSSTIRFRAASGDGSCVFSWRSADL